MLPTLLGLLCVLFLRTNGESISDNGWRPISREKVFNPRNFIKTQVYANSQTAWNPEQDSTLTGENIKSPNDREMYTEDLYPRSIDIQRKDLLLTNPDEVNDKSFGYPLNMHMPMKSIINTNEILSRKAKKINDKNFSIRDNLINDNSREDYEINKIETNDNNKNALYAVTENNDNDVTVEQSNIDEGYNYTPVKEEPRNNPTEDFLKILANYNIRSSDKLPNYALSLRQNSRQSNKIIYMQVPIRVPVGYNSPNHLLVDPVLAVFLSNYGYYLPGSYGVAGNYRNLYGYAAANNIHNNKPFGSYKIYSDTDSSH